MDRDFQDFWEEKNHDAGNSGSIPYPGMQPFLSGQLHLSVLYNMHMNLTRFLAQSDVYLCSIISGINSTMYNKFLMMALSYVM